MPDLPAPTSFGPVFRSYLRGNPQGLRTLEKELGLRKVTLRRIVEGKTVEARVVHKIITWIAIEGRLGTLEAWSAERFGLARSGRSRTLIRSGQN
jgi:hypothetical protein